ncbi:MAG: nucleoside-diphosphate kinase [Nitrospirota bacterium]
MIEKTLSIIKPDGVEQNIIGDIIKRYEEKGLKVTELKMIEITKKEAEKFYYIHKERPFFDSLTSFMSSGKIVVLVLEGENAIKKTRELMGNTDPELADPGTIRRDYASSIERNIVHGSDSMKSAAFEISYFFTLYPYTLEN